MPKISVIMPVRNDEKTVPGAIESVLSQSFRDFELIVVDNASSDASAQLIGGFSDPRLRLVRLQYEEGKSAALNAGLIRSSGDYLAILEATDMCLPGRLEKQAAVLDNHPEIGAVFSHADISFDEKTQQEQQQRVFKEDVLARNRTRHEWLRHFFYHGQALCHSSAMIRRHVLAEVGLYEVRLEELADLDLWVRICLKHGLFVLTEKLVRVRLEEARIAGKPPLETAIRHQWGLRKVLERFQTISAEDLMLAFPESKQYCLQLDSRDIPYVLARLALDSGGMAQRNFGQDILYALLDPELGFDLPGRFDFRPADLIRSAGQGPVTPVHEMLIMPLQIAALEASFREKMDRLNQLRDLSRALVRGNKR